MTVHVSVRDLCLAVAVRHHRGRWTHDLPGRARRFDHAHRVRGDRQGYSSGTVGLAYVTEDRFRGAVHYELRSREELGHVLTAGIAGPLSPDVTALVNYRLADLPLASALARDTQTLAALAWRPATSDRYGLLFSWNHGSRNAALVSGQDASRVGRLSTDGYLAPGRTGLTTLQPLGHRGPGPVAADREGVRGVCP